jgi:cytoskeletal protein CcmA (bactofilin family)
MMFGMLLKRKKKQEGAVLITALIVLVVASLLVIPVISLLTAGLNAGRVVEEETDMLYAADAGVETAILTISNLPDSVPYGRLNGITEEGESTDDYQFIISSVNGISVDILIKYYAYDEGVFKIYAVADSTTVQATVLRSEGNNLMAFQGALVSSGDITLKKDATITGDIICAGAFDPQGSFIFDYDNYDIYEYQDVSGYFPSDPQLADFALKYENEAMATGNIYTGDYYINSNVNLGPIFIDGNLIANSDVTINLTGTVYVTGSIDIQKSSNITGSYSIIAVGDIYVGKMPNYTANADSIIFSLTGDINFKKEANLHALVYAPNGNVSFDKESTVYGSIVCGGQVEITEIDIDKSFTITYDPIYAETLILPGYVYGTPSILSWEIS